MGNGIAWIDEQWRARGRPSVLAAQPVVVAPAEELIWHRLFISERHRHDMSDIQHLLLCVGDSLDWERLLTRVGAHWPLLLAQLQMFSYVYPGYRSNVPAWVMEQLIEQARADIGRDEEDADVTRGTMISRFSFAIDVGSGASPIHEASWSDRRATRRSSAPSATPTSGTNAPRSEPSPGGIARKTRARADRPGNRQGDPSVYTLRRRTNHPGDSRP